MDAPAAFSLQPYMDEHTHIHRENPGTTENILQSPEDLARIKSFCGTEIYNDTRWWGHIAEYEGDITSKERTKRVERKYKRRQEALKDRQANTKELPENQYCTELITYISMMNTFCITRSMEAGLT